MTSQEGFALDERMQEVHEELVGQEHRWTVVEGRQSKDKKAWFFFHFFFSCVASPSH